MAQGKSEEQIIHDIEYHIGFHRDDCDFPNWYVGITAHPEGRLFNEHNVNKDDKCDWIYRRAVDVRVARRVEKYFVEKHGTQGGPGGGDDRSLFVYAYRVSSHTSQQV